MADILTKKIIELENITNYQDGAIVSKMVIAKKTGTVTHFSFAKGEGLSEHTAPFDAMVYIVDGSAKIVISGEEFLLNRGETIIMPANEPHALYAEENFKMILIMIKE